MAQDIAAQEALTGSPGTGPRRPWLLFALITTACWGVWGALIEMPEKAGFPPTLGYSVWALTMIPCAVVALRLNAWKLDRDPRSILLGLVVGFTGAGGQLVLFEALKRGPAYIVFPVISLSPLVTIALSVSLLKERARRKQWLGIALALPALILLSYAPPDGTVIRGYLWLALAFGAFFAWGFQAYVMKFSNERMAAESIFFYMAVAALLLIPVALAMTDFAQPINWGIRGPWLAAMIHVLNSVGALLIVYAFRYGKAIIVAPMTNALAPVITIVLSLALYGRLPLPAHFVGMVFAITAIWLMSE